MKPLFLALIATLAISQTANATSLYYGPYVSKVVGDVERDQKTWQVCFITPNSVTARRYVNGVETTTKQTLNLDPVALKKIIAQASTERLVRVGVHVMEAIPGYKISAGHNAARIPNFELASDGGSMMKRSGHASESLLVLVREVCPQ